MNEDQTGIRSLVALGVIGLAMLAITAVLVPTGNDPAWYNDDANWSLWTAILIVCGFLALAATQVAAHAPQRRAFAVIAIVALALRIVVLIEPPVMSTDIYRYVWDGMVQAHGINPYRYVPADPALVFLRDTLIYPNINRVDYATTIYPPVAQMFFLAVTRLGETITVMRLGMIGCEVVTFLVIVDLLRRLGKPVTLSVAYAWHPLAFWEVANNGHVDALMVMLVMIGVWLAVRHRNVFAGVLIALGALAKPYAIVALPAVWRPWDWRLPLAVMVTIVICYLPYLGVGEGALGFFINGYLSEEGFEGGRGFWLVHVLQTAFGKLPALVPIYLALAAATMGLIALRAAFTQDVSPERTIRNIALLFMATLFFLTPNYPWYYLVIVPFIPLGGGAPAWAMTIGAMLLYLLLPDYEARFLIWKGVIEVAFLIALFATMQRAPSAMKPHGLLQWTR